MATETIEKVKEKTKSKKRYLKRKKERRKLKGKTNNAKSPAGAGSVTAEDADGDEEGIEEEHEQVTETIPQPTNDGPVLIKERRKKKRRKLESEVEVDGISQHVGIENNELHDMDVEPVTLEEPTQRTFPLFPLPILPDAPTKSSLALQGLDPALLDAEVVDPSLTIGIPQGGSDTRGTYLGERMRIRLHELEITELFAVQTALLPFLLPENPLARGLYLPFDPPRDVCVSAPTGSGKTLAYVLPIIEVLSVRVVTRLRALVVLPTRDLVIQVKETFEVLGKGRGLKIGTATGQHSFPHEQSQLVSDRLSDLQGGSSKVDILICTPGRLIDHLNATPNFSLQHLRFLVIDEADRLLAQSFQEWLVQVLAATQSTRLPTISRQEQPISFLPLSDAVSPSLLQCLPMADIPTFVTEHKEASCQKLLFSATLTRDPGNIAALELRNPKYFIVQNAKRAAQDSSILDVVMEKFSIPSTLTERYVVCETSQKPLMFCHLVHSFQVTNALVFTKSAESTTRLVKLFEFFERARSLTAMAGSTKSIVLQPYSSDLSSSERKAILEKFKAQEIHILVCSDLISRGIDISHVSHVVSYDIPVDMRKYVHRVGRTARAGRAGDAWTLVEEQEARYFKDMLKEADHLDKLKRIRVSNEDIKPLQPFYESALSNLRNVYQKQSRDPS